MFANLKKKIESEVGDLSRLTPNLRSITHSEKMTPLSSRHNSVSSLASETSYSNKLSSPLSPSDRDASMYGGSSSKMESGVSNSNRSTIDVSQQKMKRVFEEKLQTQELDFANSLNSKDEEISKLQKQVEHINNVLHSKEFETQQKLVRVQEDMDSLEGFSQQENAKIKHLLLNREEELSQLRATVMMRDSAISDFQTQIKGVTVENERLRKSLDEVVGRQGNFGQQKEDEEDKKKLKLNEERLMALESESLRASEELQEKTKSIQLLQKSTEQLQVDLQVSLTKVASLEQQVIEKSGVISSLESDMTVSSEQNTKREAELIEATDSLNLLKLGLEEENERLRKSLDDVIERQGNFEQKLEDEEEKKKLKLNEERLMALESESLRAREQLQEYAKNIQVLQQSSEQLKVDLQVSITKVASLEKQITEKDRVISNLESEMTVSFEQNTTREAELIKATNSLNLLKLGLEEENERLRKSLDDVVERQGSFEQHREDAEEKKKLKLTEERLMALESEFLRAREELQENAKNMHVLRQSSEQLKVDLQVSITKIASLEQQIIEKDRVISNLESKSVRAREELQETVKNMHVLRQSSEQLKVDLQVSITKIASLEQQIIKKDRVISNLESESVRAREEVQENAKNIQVLRQSREQLQVDLQVSLTKVANLEQQITEKDGVISNLESELTVSFEQNIKREAELIEATDSLSLLKLGQEEKEAELDSLKLKLSQIEQQLAHHSILDADEVSKTTEEIKILRTELAEKEESISVLESQLEDVGSVEIENSELVLQISEIQSKCDELEEENKFLKDSVQPNEDDGLKRKLAELEGELLDKNQILKQQSHQLQDLRRSLAKEINKNQAATENAVVNETTSPCNGSMTQSSAIISMSSMQPPTLPPQETDVNFMYLRSVLFKYLTTTDVQVTHQLTRVVATLLHLSEEEAHLLNQSAESRNRWVPHLIAKS